MTGCITVFGGTGFIGRHIVAVLNRVTNPPIEIHDLHPPAPASFGNGHLLLEFYSGATGQPGRFSEGFLLRRLHHFGVSIEQSCRGTADEVADR
jgi:nucleoside-diphosphate-sugar epimerase